MKRIRFSWRELAFGAALITLIAAAGALAPPASAQASRPPPLGDGGIQPGHRLPPAAIAQTSPPPVETVRPEVGKVLQAAQELLKENKFAEALAKLREAEAIADRTPYENFVIDRIRGVAAARSGDMATAAKSFEAVVETKRLPPAEQLKTIESLGILYFREKDYAKATTWLSRYFAEGGADPKLRLPLVQSRYQTNDFAGAAKDLRAIIDAEEKAGTVPPLDQLQLLGSCYIKLNDEAGYALVLEKVLAHHPKKEYWFEAIQRAELRPGFADHLSLDVLRLLQATGNLASAAQYTSMAQLALKAGFPAEAKRVLDQGFASGALGTGADADAQKRLRDQAAKQVSDDEKSLATDARNAEAAKDGTAQVNVGFALVSAGQFDKGLALMEQGLQKGGVRRPDEAKLHLAIAYAAAGQKAKAIEAFKTVQGSDGTADLARLWLIHVQRPAT